MQLLKQYIPFLSWISEYNKQWLISDTVAGLTVGIMLIPQGMAYAMLAGLPAEYGLYAALIPQVIYAFLGTSRQLAVGPVAMDSLLVATIVSALANNPERYIDLALTLALMMGALQFLLGLFRFGFLVNFLSRPVISAFTFAAALIIGLNQIKHLVGISFDKGVTTNTIQDLAAQVYKHLPELNWVTLSIGIAGIIIIKAIKKFTPKIPAALVVVILGIVTVFLFRLDLLGVRIVEEIPKGLPKIGLPSFNFDDFKALIPAAFTLALIAFMEAISVAKAIEEKHTGYKVDPNQELIALGAGNFGGAFFSSYPVTGGFSRSAVSDQAGSKTGISAIVSALLILFTLLFLTEYFWYLPKALLGSIIMVAVFGLIDLKVPKKLWKFDKMEFGIYLITFVSTLTIGIQQGIGIGVLLSLLAILYQISYPKIALLGKVENTNEYRNIDRYPNAIKHTDVLIVRLDARLFYANMNILRDKIHNEIVDSNGAIKLIVLSGKAINGIDISAFDMLTTLVENLNKLDIDISFVEFKGPIRDKLVKAGFVEAKTKEKFFVSVDSAIEAYKNNNQVAEHYKEEFQ
ncbi:MAG: SulP family inorganic anion transporter [Putridiphycobacter sp.]